MLRHRLPLLAIITALTATANAALAAPVLDQSTLGPDVGNSATMSFNAFAQTFTVGIAGTLTGVAFGVFDKGETGGALVAEIRTTAAGAPTSTVLASVSLDPSQIKDPIPTLPVGAADLNPIDLSLFDIQVSVGDVLALVLFLDPTSANYSVSAFLPDSYAGGTAYGQSALGFESFEGPDLPLQTFVEPRAIPEPTSLALVLGAIGGIGLAMRRRAKA